MPDRYFSTENFDNFHIYSLQVGGREKVLCSVCRCLTPVMLIVDNKFIKPTPEPSSSAVRLFALNIGPYI